MTVILKDQIVTALVLALREIAEARRTSPAAGAPRVDVDPGASEQEAWADAIALLEKAGVDVPPTGS